MAETGCLKDGHFHNLQVENLEVVKLNDGQAANELNIVGEATAPTEDIAMIVGNDLTEGKGLSITSSSTGKSTGGLLEVVQSGTTTTQAAKTLVVESSGTGVNAGAASFTSAVGEGNAVEISAPSLSTGSALNITATDTTSALNITGGITMAGGATAPQQSGNKEGSVTINKQSGRITMNGSELAASTVVSFTLLNSCINDGSVIIVNTAAVGNVPATPGSYNAFVDSVADGSCQICLQNVTAGPLSEAVNIDFIVLTSTHS